MGQTALFPHLFKNRSNWGHFTIDGVEASSVGSLFQSKIGEHAGREPFGLTTLFSSF